MSVEESVKSMQAYENILLDSLARKRQFVAFQSRVIYLFSTIHTSLFRPIQLLNFARPSLFPQPKPQYQLHQDQAAKIPLQHNLPSPTSQSSSPSPQPYSSAPSPRLNRSLVVTPLSQPQLLSKHPDS